MKKFEDAYPEDRRSQQSNDPTWDYDTRMGELPINLSTTIWGETGTPRGPPAPLPPPPAPLPGRLSTLGRLGGTSTNQAESRTEPQKYSVESTLAPFETLFNDFNLEAFPFYNFWVEDENTNESEPVGNRKLEDIPRFVKLTWNLAPDLPDLENEERQKRNRRADHPSRRESSRANWTNGILFSPEHLQKQNFSQVIRSLANGYVAPGIIESIVEIPVPSVAAMTELDQDHLLTDLRFKGVAARELLSQTQRTEDSIKIGNGGQVFIDRTSGTSVNLTIVDDSGGVLLIPTSVSNRVEQDHVEELSEGIVKRKANAVKGQTLKVKFSSPSLGGVFNEKKSSVARKPEHVETSSLLSQVAGNLESLQTITSQGQRRLVEPPSFPSPSGLKPLEYVGYVLEKYRRNEDGVFEKVEEIGIPDRETGEYYDSRLLYGEVYRYRIRSILRWTKSFPTNKIATQKSVYFGSEWSQTWTYALLLDMSPPPYPDELQVRTESARKRVCITFRIPENSQRDISEMRLMRKTKDQNGMDVENWRVLAQFPVQNVLYYDLDVDFFQENGLKYVYAVQCLSRHGEESALSEQIAIRLNADHKVFGEYLTEFVSCGGVKTEYFGSFSVNPPTKLRSETLIRPSLDGHSRVKLLGRTGPRNTVPSEGEYLVRVESLDTGQIRDHKLSLGYVFNQDFGPTSGGVSVPENTGKELNVLDGPRPGERWSQS